MILVGVPAFQSLRKVLWQTFCFDFLIGVSKNLQPAVTG